MDREPPLLEDVYFLRRARISLGDLWTEATDWAPTMVTAAVVLVVPYLMARFIDAANRPNLLAGSLLDFLYRDRVVRAAAGVTLTVLAILWLHKVVQMILERRRRVVRMDLHEIECWPDRKSRYLLVRDVVGAQVGRTEQRSRWTVLRAPRSQVVLFVKRPDDQVIERLRFDFSRHEMITEAPGGGLAEVSSDQDGNRTAADVIALLRRRRSGLGFAVEELPEADIDVTGDSGVRMVGNRDHIVLHTQKGALNIPGWAVRSAQVVASPNPRFPLQLALELDPRCGEFHLLVGLGKGPGDEEIVQWCQLLAARFDKEPISVG